jgi:hypothetical protein
MAQFGLYEGFESEEQYRASLEKAHAVRADADIGGALPALTIASGFQPAPSALASRPDRKACKYRDC